MRFRDLYELSFPKHRSIIGWNWHPRILKWTPEHTSWKYLPELDRYLYPIAKNRLRAGVGRVGRDTVGVHSVDSDGREWLTFARGACVLRLRLRTPVDVADQARPTKA